MHTVTVTLLGAGGYRVSLPREESTTTVPAGGSQSAEVTAEVEKAEEEIGRAHV